MQTDDEKAAFFEVARQSVSNGTFLKMTLGKYRGKGEPRKCAVTLIMLKQQQHLRFVTSVGTQVASENELPQAGFERLAGVIGSDYYSAVLFTSGEDVGLAYSKKRIGRLTRGKPTMTQAPSIEHNRQKTYLVDPKAPYLAHLGVTHADGQVRPSMYAKYRQICRFVEIIDQLLAGSQVRDAPLPHIVDIGSGKGYLTFALHEHFAGRLGRAPVTRGIESNGVLVEKCNAVAAQCNIVGLTFETGRAEQQTSDTLDILIALHACDTATDDAIHLGITSKAQMIICAPCCQHEIAPQLETRATPLAGLLKYGLLKQRQADLFTDACRGLLLEAHGYEVRMIEFISSEHTSKNLMIAAVRSNAVDRASAAAQYDQLARLAGFERQRLKMALENHAVR